MGRDEMGILAAAKLCAVVSLGFMVNGCAFNREAAAPQEHVMTHSDPSKPSDQAGISHLIGRLANSDIRWDGTYIGLTPTVEGKSARDLLAVGDVAIPQLIEALDDEAKFAAAHVLLTLISHVEYQTNPWNALRVDLNADGRTWIDPQQRFQLARSWRAWNQATPRSRSLELK